MPHTVLGEAFRPAPNGGFARPRPPAEPAGSLAAACRLRERPSPAQRSGNLYPNPAYPNHRVSLIIGAMPPADQTNFDPQHLLDQIRGWAGELGFADVGVSALDLGETERRLFDWLDRDLHGDMDYMARHGVKRTRPEALVPGTLSVLSLRMDYLPESQQRAIEVLENADLAYVSRYALGRDYHKLIRQRLKKLAQKIESQVPGCSYRVFTDSAPVMEKPIARQAGMGWLGKHTNLINRESGSWFFLGEIYLDLPLPETGSRGDHCGDCTACIDVCPTDAIIAPYELDARRCISYLTIENNGDIPLEFRRQIGNRIYGCDDCQLYCPWNRFAPQSPEPDFQARHQLDASTLRALFAWSEAAFLSHFEGSPIRRIGHRNWLRNIAVALGNAPRSPENLAALRSRESVDDEGLREHIRWAIEQQL